MKRCPITYLPIEEGKYSKQGLHLLSPQLENLKDFPFGEDKQLELMLEAVDKLSFSGVQPKLSAILNVQQQTFDVVKKGGTFLLKLQRYLYPELPQNEDLTMKLAACAGIPVPKHGLIYTVDQTLLYFIERFDRSAGGKIYVEDLGQAAGLDRDKKYDSSMEKVAHLIEQFCTFPGVEKKRLFHLTLFNFLIGNEDMHLKNFSLIKINGVIQLSPSYDLVNSTIAIPTTKEEIALPLRGKKSHLNAHDLIDYYGNERLKLTFETTQEVLGVLKAAIPKWKEIIASSFLSEKRRIAYLDLLERRAERLFVKEMG